MRHESHDLQVYFTSQIIFGHFGTFFLRFFMVFKAMEVASNTPGQLFCVKTAIFEVKSAIFEEKSVIFGVK